MTPVLESPTQETSDVTGARSPRSTKGKSARNRTSRPERSPIPKTSANGLESAHESETVSSAISTVDFEPENDATSSENDSNENGVAGLTQPSTPSPDTTSMAVMQDKISTTEGGTSWPLLLLPIEAIGPNPFQPREEFDEAELEELAASIKEHGVQSPVIVRTVKPSVSSPASNALDESGALATPLFAFELIAGERRLRASRLAKVKFIPVIVRDDLTDAQAAELALVENVQRSNLNIIEEGRGYKRLMLRFRFTEKRIAKKVGKSVPTIQAAIKLLDLPEEVQTLLLKKQLSAAHGHELLRLAAYPEICVLVALRALAEKITAAALSQNVLPNVQQLKRRGQVVELGYATKFDWRSECQSCPFKAFVSSGHSAYCLRPDEWRRKQEHALEMEKQEAARVLEAARSEGEATVKGADLPNGSYCNLRWNEPPAGCSLACECRGQIADSHDAAKTIPICLNPEKFKDLQRAQRLAQEEERKRHYAQLASAAFAGIAGTASLPDEATFPISAAETPNGGSNYELALPKDSLPEQVESYETPQGNMSAGIESGVSDRPVRALSPEQDSGETFPRTWTLQNLDLRKIAPILVLPALAGSHGDYYSDRNWEEMVERTAQELGIDLPLDDIMGQIDDAVPLRLLEAVDPLSLLLLGAAVLVRQEAEHAMRWEGETPRLQFVLGLQRGEQREIELESEDTEAEDAVPDHPMDDITGGEADITLEPKAVAVLTEERDQEDIEQSEDMDRGEDKLSEEPNPEERDEGEVVAAKDEVPESEIEDTDDDAIIAALELDQEEEYAGSI